MSIELKPLINEYLVPNELANLHIRAQTPQDEYLLWSTINRAFKAFKS